MHDIGFHDPRAQLAALPLIAVLVVVTFVRTYRRISGSVMLFPLWPMLFLVCYCFGALIVFGLIEGLKCFAISTITFGLLARAEVFFAYSYQPSKTPNLRILVVWPIMVFGFLLLVITLVSVAWWWTTNLMNPESAFVRDRSQWLYETRSMLAGAQAILLGACALSIPYLTSLWTDAAKAISSEVVIHSEMLLDNRMKNKWPRIRRDLSGLQEYYCHLRMFSQSVRPLFLLGGAFTILLFVLSAFACFIPGKEAAFSWSWYDDRLAYIAPPILAAFAMALMLWYVTLSLAFLIIVRSYSRRFDHTKFYLPKSMEEDIS